MGFFEQIGKKTTEVVQSAKDKTNKISSELKLKSKLSDNKDRISLLNMEIGKEIYSNFSKNIDNISEDIKNKCNEIKKLNEENDEINKKILVLKNVKICATCGAEVPANAEYCPQCGIKQVTVVKTEEAKSANDVEVVEIKDVENTENKE